MTITSEALYELEQQVSGAVMTSASSLVDSWLRQKQVNFKERSDPVTEFDVRIENDLRAELATFLPEAGFIVEEGETIRSEVYNWVIDPIDQTKNFVGEVPLFFTQIALMENNIPILGVVYNPVSKQIFSASRGNGTRLNGQTLKVTGKQDIGEAIVDVDFGDGSDATWKLGVVERLAVSAFRLRITGGAYAVHLLTGGIDAFVVVNQKTKPVDQLPRMIVMREAGLTFEEFQVNSYKVLIAGHSSVVRQVVRFINDL